MASGGNDGTVRVWDVATGKESATLKHSDFVQGLAFRPDGKALTTGSIDGVVRHWDLKGGK